MKIHFYINFFKWRIGEVNIKIEKKEDYCVE